jgi:pimeloyl-ACP methyl ester carboxylesterase
MHVERFGSGKTIYYCLHGWNGDHRTFLPLVSYLPPFATLVAPDLPGCGRSPAPARWVLEEVTEVIARSIVQEAKGPVVVIGNCSGGLLALGAALLLEEGGFSEAICRMVLIDPFAYWPWYFRVFLSKGWGRYAYAATFANPLGRWITNFALRSKRRSETNLTEGFASADHEILFRYLNLLREIGPIEQFRRLRIPIDLVYGERTFHAVRRSIAVWKRIWPQAAVWSLPQAGHLPIQEAAGDLSRIIFGGDACPFASVLISGNRYL